MDELTLPPFLQQGDKVVILSPSGKIDKHFLEGAHLRLESWGLKVVVARHADGASGRFAGTVKQRVTDFQRALDDEKTKAILCSRGGYGAVHLMDKLDFTAFKEHPKWLLGYSDITLLHALMQYNGYASIHSLMARHLTVESGDDPCTTALRNLLFGHLPVYQFGGHKLNRKGVARGVLRGGNLSVLYGMRATPYDLVPQGTILFIEDIGERPYHIDRMMWNLKLGGVLEQLSGLIVGQFTEYEEDKSLGKEVYGLIADIVKEYDYPVAFDFPVGHVSANYPLVCGAAVELDVSKKTVELKTLSAEKD